MGVMQGWHPPWGGAGLAVIHGRIGSVAACVAPLHASQEPVQDRAPDKRVNLKRDTHTKENLERDGGQEQNSDLRSHEAAPVARSGNASLGVRSDSNDR
jgi:hypothetical protein